jgi:hypothetical protein
LYKYYDLFHFTSEETFKRVPYEFSEIGKQVFSVGLVYLTADKIFVTFYQEKVTKPAAGDKEMN